MQVCLLRQPLLRPCMQVPISVLVCASTAAAAAELHGCACPRYCQIVDWRDEVLQLAVQQVVQFRAHVSAALCPSDAALHT